MSYYVPAWISEYNYDVAMNHRLDREAPGKQVAASTPALLVWGGADEEGTPYLNPVFAVDAPPSLPDGGGDHQITGRTADGDVLFSVAFDMKPVADTEGRTGFAFAIPSSCEWTDVLVEVELSGPGGSAIIDEDSIRPALILRKQTSGCVRPISPRRIRRTDRFGHFCGRLPGARNRCGDPLQPRPPTVGTKVIQAAGSNETPVSQTTKGWNGDAAKDTFDFAVRIPGWFLREFRQFPFDPVIQAYQSDKQRF